MFPDPCGEEFERRVAGGADPRTVVPDDFVVVRGGTSPMPAVGSEFSCSTGPDLASAACAVPHGQLRATTAGAIRQAGGRVEWVAEYSPHRTLNKQHVNVADGSGGSFGGLEPNPVPRADRIDG